MLESLKITECPYAFAALAAKHNQLCDLIAGIVGQNGVTVTITERNAIIAGSGSGGSGGSGGNVDLTGIIANIAALQTLTSGLTRQNVTYCSGGSNTTITILRS
jgi:hypothetical protein